MAVGEPVWAKLGYTLAKLIPQHVQRPESHQRSTQALLALGRMIKSQHSSNSPWPNRQALSLTDNTTKTKHNAATRSWTKEPSNARKGAEAKTRVQKVASGRAMKCFLFGLVTMARTEREACARKFTPQSTRPNVVPTERQLLVVAADMPPGRTVTDARRMLRDKSSRGTRHQKMRRVRVWKPHSTRPLWATSRTRRQVPRCQSPTYYKTLAQRHCWRHCASNDGRARTSHYWDLRRASILDTENQGRPSV